jgi:hypothetical protein
VVAVVAVFESVVQDFDNPIRRGGLRLDRPSDLEKHLVLQILGVGLDSAGVKLDRGGIHPLVPQDPRRRAASGASRPPKTSRN